MRVQVVVAAPTSFASVVDRAGFEHRAFADAPGELIGPIFARLASLTFEEANGVVVADAFARVDAQAALPGLVETIESWRPDVVLREPCEFGSLAGARAAGVPQVTVAIGVSATTDYVAPIVSAPLAELDVAAGLPEGTAEAVMTSTTTLTCVPPLLDAAGAHEPPRELLHRFREDAAASSGVALPDPWGDPEHPLLYVTFGSVAANLGDFADVYPGVLDAFADQPVRVLLTTGEGVDPAALAPVPDNASVQQWWPQADVMPHAAAMIGHGGFGTTMAALAAGVPQAVLPLFAVDQRINGEHVAAVGAGINLDGGPDAVAQAPAAIAQLIADPSYANAARAVADEMAGLPRVSDAVGLVEQVAAG